MIARLTLWDTIGAFLTRSQPKAPGAAPGLSLTSLGHRKAPNQEASEGVGPSVTTRGALPMESRQAAPEHQRGQWLPKDQARQSRRWPKPGHPWTENWTSSSQGEGAGTQRAITTATSAMPPSLPSD